MAFNLQSNLGGAGTNADSIVMKALREEVTNESRKDTIVYANAKAMPIGDVDYRFSVDEFRNPTATDIKAENYSVTASDAQSDSRNPYQATAQINGITIGSSNTANAVKQAGGPTQNYNLGKQLVEITHSYDFQATSTGTTSVQTTSGTRRTASIAAYAGTVSTNGGNQDNAAGTPYTTNALRPRADGSSYFEAGTDQGFAAVLLNQGISVAAGKFKPNFDSIAVPTSLRTTVSSRLITGSSANQWNLNAGSKEVVQGVDRYNTDFGTFKIMDSWIMDINGSSDSMFVYEEAALRKGVVRDLMENEEVVSNSDGQLQEYVMENANFVSNQSCVLHIRNLTAVGAAASAARASANVNRAVLRK